MSQSGVKVAPGCIDKFNELKLNKKIKFIIYKISDDCTSIVVEETSEDEEWQYFCEKLINAKSISNKTNRNGPGPRYAVYDFHYDLPNGEGSRNKITFITWIPDRADIFLKMTYSASKDALKRSLNGIAVECQANDPEDIEHKSVLHKVSKGLA